MNTKYIPYSLLFLLLVIFTFTYGVAFFPTLDADHAIHVIMIDHLSFPDDLYYMGQDRIGSIIPGLGWFFYQAGAPSVWAVTLVQLVIYLVSGLVLIRLFRNWILACASLLILMLPLSEFESQVLSGHPYVGHVLVLFLAIAAFKRFGLARPVVFLFIGIGIWSSGIFAANVAAAGLIYLGSQQIRLKNKAYRKWLLEALLWTLPGIALLATAKLTATTTDNNYSNSSLVTLEQLWQNLKLFGNHLEHFLSFSHPDPLMSMALWLLFAVLAISIPILIKQKLASWSWFFILSGTITIIAVLLSEWAFRMSLPLRYFSIGYIQLLWGSMLAWDSKVLQGKYARAAVLFFLINAILVASSGLMAQGKFWRRVPGRLYAATAHKLADSIKTEGILGSYWYVYLIEAFDPENLTSLVHEHEINRDFPAMKRFLEFDTITIIKNSFVPELGDSIFDHGVYYLKTGPVQKVDEVEFAEYYKPQQFLGSYHFSALRVNYGDTVVTPSGESALKITPENFTGNNYAVYGPYVTLPPGKYEACFNLSTIGDVGPEAHVDMSIWRQFEKKAYLSNIENDKLCIEFELTEPLVKVEFRIIYYGKGTILFKSVELESEK